VGLVSDQWQADDLRLMIPVIQHLANEVEWVVMGDHTDVLRAYIRERHALPNADAYPAAIAGLNLDLALLPAVDNLFNACKSNITLMQLGSCGVPVVCSDVRAYEGPFQVTRVADSLSAWIDAIRLHTQDPAFAKLNGDRLREQVLRDGMLDDAALQSWQSAWLR
jgi:hypothetical protein